jgi:signal transduction histidine kinase
MKPRRLAVILTRQWMLFAALGAALFGAGALLLLFLVEDSFIDRRLKAAAASVVDPATAHRTLPPGFRIYPATDAPLDIHARLPWAQRGGPFEMRRADGSYVHALLEETPAGRPFVLVYDVTDQLTISPRWRMGLLLMSSATAVVLFGAFLFARAFVSRVGDRASALVAGMKTTRDPVELRALAGRQDVHEFQQLLLLHADAWAAELASVDRERQTLAQLAHELRTPLQSAQTSLAILADDRTDPAAWQRLERAIARLGRASTAILWMASEQEPRREQRAEVVPTLRALIDEFVPFAEARHQQFELDVLEPADWNIRQDIADAILGNVLMNAIQHGAPGIITVRIERGGIAIANPAGVAPRTGFGVGMHIVQRLADRVGWRLAVSHEAQTVHVRLSWSG